MRASILTSLGEGAAVVTANRRAARALELDYARQQIAAGNAAWRSPAVSPYTQWLGSLLDSAVGTAHRQRLGSLPCRLIWESCLIEELREQPANLAGMVRSAEEAWRQVAGFLISPDELEQAAESRDQGVFARTAKRFIARIDAGSWIDDARLDHYVTDLIGSQSIAPPERSVWFGFDRVTPAQARLRDAIERAGAVVEMPQSGEGGAIATGGYADESAELRAAGAWARECLLARPDARVGIVVSGLESDPERAAALVKEGLLPGWQTLAGPGPLNVSLGARLDSFPMISVALLILRWLSGPLTSRQVGVLLRSAAVGRQSDDSRSRLEVRLRGIPGRDWTPTRFCRVFEDGAADPDVVDFIGRVARLGEFAGEASGDALPATWAERFDHALSVYGWPGSAALISAEQQLLNRWRTLLNEFAALERVSGPVSGGAALRRLRQLARDVVFQPEDTGSVVSVLGPLEAAGLDFDDLRITGLTAAQWPSPRRPTPLVARSLRRRAGLPDATPEDALEFAGRVLKRLSASSGRVCGSFAMYDGDREQAITMLVPVVAGPAEPPDPGWFASACRDTTSIAAAADPVPPLKREEAVRGGAAIIDRQIAEPLGAFVLSRLYVDSLDAFAEGLTPAMRGTLIHDALRHLYADRPSQRVLEQWVHTDLDTRIRESVRRAAARHRVAAGATLERLLDFEEERVCSLLATVVETDLSRSPFQVDSVEAEALASVAGLDMNLRLDRVDIAEDGGRIILDYKTGTKKRLLESGEPVSYQLVVYAMAAAAAVTDIGLYNVDPRATGIDGYGEHLDDKTQLPARMGAWAETVTHAARRFVAGDVRMNLVQGSLRARATSLLSRYEERVRDGAG